jgi:hypothetical protein
MNSRAHDRERLFSPGRWWWMGLAWAACGGVTSTGVSSDAGGDRLMPPANVTSEAGTCPGPYEPASPGTLPYGEGCVSASALISCQLTAPEDGPVSCFQNVRSELQCGESGEHDCMNVCAPGEYAALCSAFDGSMPDGGGPFTDARCHSPNGNDVEGLSSVRYFCCACKDE